VPMPRGVSKLYREKVGSCNREKVRNWSERRFEAVLGEGLKLYREKVGSCTERRLEAVPREGVDRS
jgi:hypothetical protein